MRYKIAFVISWTRALVLVLAVAAVIGGKLWIDYAFAHKDDRWKFVPKPASAP